ncbi:MAG: hypothetical protein FWF18_03220 [Dehalococcoidia bacterium]|nr:hypothetical protein [Dehalococcoidia bacterium]
MKNKKVVASCVLSVCLIAMLATTAVSCHGNNDAGESRYNLNPDVSGKVIASNSAPINRLVPQILLDTLSFATCVIIGEVVDDGVVTTTEMLSLTGFSYEMYYTTANIKVLDTIAGEPPSGDIIRYRQGGSPEAPWHTQVKKGETGVFILFYREQIDQYMAAAFEESVWYVDGKNKLTSMSDQPFAAKYDGIDLGILIEDVKEAFALAEEWLNSGT